VYMHTMSEQCGSRERRAACGGCGGPAWLKPFSPPYDTSTTMRMMGVRRASNRSDCISCDLKSADPAGCQGRHTLVPSSAHPDCLIIVSRCTRTHSLYPPRRPGHGVPFAAQLEHP